MNPTFIKRKVDHISNLGKNHKMHCTGSSFSIFCNPHDLHRIAERRKMQKHEISTEQRIKNLESCGPAGKTAAEILRENSKAEMLYIQDAENNLTVLKRAPDWATFKDAIDNYGEGIFEFNF